VGTVDSVSNMNCAYVLVYALQTQLKDPPGKRQCINYLGHSKIHCNPKFPYVLEIIHL